MDLLFVKSHNVCAFLDANDPKSAEFVSVLTFLANSNISFVISHNIPVIETTIRQFWEIAEIVNVENVEHIRATIHDQEVLFSEDTAREALHFNDYHQSPIEFSTFYIKECFRRMGHPYEFKSGQIIKNSLPPHWRYVVHVFIHYLSIRKGGFDYANALIIINHLHPNLQQDGHVFVFDYMTAKTLSYMKSTSKMTNRAIADIPLFGHIIGEEEEFIPDIDPDLEVEDLSSKEEEDDGNIRPIIEAPFIDPAINVQEEEVQVQVEHVVDAKEEAAESSGTLDAGIYDSDYYKSESDKRTEPPASSSKRQADSGSDYELEEPRDKKIKTGLEDLSSSSESLFETPQPTPPPSPQPTPQPTPPPSPQHIHILTPLSSSSHEPTSEVPRVKTLSLEVKKLHDHIQEKDKVIESLTTKLNECKKEVKDLKLEVRGLHTQLDVQQTQLEAQHKLISQQQHEFKVLAESVEQLKALPVKPVQQQATTSTAQGETTSGVEPSSPAFFTDPESAMTIYTGHAAKTKEAMEVKVEEQEIDLPSASERREARKRGKGTMTEIETMK
ncbi:hypothetical protein L1987_71250 [Smallanthus sonchifolius]|uniref:Uncharacterized protein n=1 Tax=Smallanthus sonchifolius TaxID=185202 RepID=A0ACB9ASI6_9ASTR|nr:hypothetical protein L1987_71250 [Smallanthus sonchifolius]